MTLHLSEADGRALLAKHPNAKVSKSVGDCLAELERKAAKPALQSKVMVTDGEIRICLYGKPCPKPRMTQRDKWAKRPCVVRYREWADRLRALAADVPPANRVKILRINAYFEPPKSWPKVAQHMAAGNPHADRVDVDNICKAVMDVLWKQDSGISSVTVRKFWAWQARTEIEILLLTDIP